MQTSCFSTPVGIDIDASKDVDCRTNCSIEGKQVVYVTVTAKGRQSYYIFSSEMDRDGMYMEWGRLNKDVNELLDELVGKRINAHGREKKPKQQ